MTQVTRLQITEQGRSALQGCPMESHDRALLETLLNRGPMGRSRLSRVLDQEVPHTTLRSLERAGWMRRERKVRPGRVRPKKERYVKAVANSLYAGSLSQARRKVLRIVEDSGEISIRALKAEIPSAGPLVKKMAADGLLDLLERQVYRDPFGEAIEQPSNPPVLTEEQHSVVATVLEGLDKGFQAYLLHGVTGSGKTEVYMAAVAAALDKGHEAMVLVPEIALISQTERRFRARFGDCIALLHSGLSEGERFDQWMRIARKEVKVAIGARSAIFSPFDHLGLIIVDEEHDDSYKSASGGVRYHARDLALVRAKLDGAVALLGSATPSVQSYYNVQEKKSQGLHLWKRIQDQVLPEVSVVDLRQTEGRRRTSPFMTQELKDAISQTLDRREQVLLFLNRRGFAHCPTCSCCGAPVRCKNCDITMTLHRESHAFRCHYCGHTCAQTVGCQVCGSTNIKLLGLGTERVEAEVKAIFPQAKVARIDRDTTGRKGALVRILKALREGAIDILVGTQMVAKGHHYPKITLVGILCADLSLNFPDFRAGERTFQLLAQVAGRAGRGKQKGRVILQTFNPEHFCIVTAGHQDYPAFYAHEIGYRRDLHYPPYSRLVQIVVTGRQRDQTARYAQRLGQIARTLQQENSSYGKEIQVLGPVQAPLARLKKRYRWQLLLKGLKVAPLHGLSRALKAKAEGDMGKGGVKMIVDVDPVDMM